MKRWLLLLLVFASADAWAITIRGRVDIALQYGVVPMAGATVSLCYVGQGCMNYVTGPDGMYYFNAVPGDHFIMVNGVQHARLMIPNQPHMDIAPIRVN